MIEPNERSYIRVLPSLIMNQIFVGTFSVLRICVPDVYNLGFVQDLVVETQDPLIFLIAEVACWRHSHGRQNRNT